MVEYITKCNPGVVSILKPRIRRWNPELKRQFDYLLENTAYVFELASQLDNNARVLDPGDTVHRSKCIELFEGAKKDAISRVVRIRFVRFKDAFLKLGHGGVFYEYNENFDA